MVKKQILIALIVLSLVTMACGLRFNLPITDLKSGPTVEENIDIPTPVGTEGSAVLELNFGAGELFLKPAPGQGLVSGVVTYNVADLKPEITTSGNRVPMTTGDLEIKGIPNFDQDFKNTWDLALGVNPLDLTVSSGAYKGRMELGGLALTSLKVTDGAADVQLSFSDPNLVEMDTLRYETGASKVELRGLGNANFSSMIFKGGAGEYILDFSGELVRDATVTIDAGLSQITLNIPSGVPARVMVDGGLANVDLDSGWSRDGDEYTTEGQGPSLTINVNLGAGNLKLESR
jgi:hypothetical protein